LSPIAISGIVFALIFGSTLVGMLLRSILPEHHLSADSKEVVRLATAMIATLAALVLGLLIASTRSSYDQTKQPDQSRDRRRRRARYTAREYGPDAVPLRQMLRASINPMADSIWRDGARDGAPFRPSAQGETAFFRLQELSPGNAVQRAVQARAVQISTIWLKPGASVRPAGGCDVDAVPDRAGPVADPDLRELQLFAQPNAAIVTVLLVCVLSTSSAIFLILEMGSPFSG